MKLLRKRWVVAVAALLVVAAVVAFYMLGKQDLWVRVIALLVLMAAAVLVHESRTC